jgi:hypothetical protein
MQLERCTSCLPQPYTQFTPLPNAPQNPVSGMHGQLVTGVVNLCCRYLHLHFPKYFCLDSHRRLVILCGVPGTAEHGLPGLGRHVGRCLVHLLLCCRDGDGETAPEVHCNGTDSEVASTCALSIAAVCATSSNCP